jgi:hypothetical protein
MSTKLPRRNPQIFYVAAMAKVHFQPRDPRRKAARPEQSASWWPPHLAVVFLAHTMNA